MPLDSKVLHLNIPIPFTVGSVNIYAVKGPGGYYLIDAGIITDEARKLINEWLPDPLAGIMITHGHLDHLGLAGELAKARGCPIYMNSIEYRRSRDPMFRSRVMALLMENGGVPSGLIAEVLQSFRNSMQDFIRPLTGAEVKETLPGQKFATELGPLEVLYTPGHSIGHCCFYLSEDKTLFSGDHILASILPNPLLDMTVDGNRRFAYMEYLQSVDKIASLSIQRVYPGHGPSFDNLKKVLNKIRIFDMKREKMVVAALSEKFKTPFEVAQKIYPGLKGYDIFLSLSKIWGQLDLLEQQGKVISLERGNSVCYCLP